MSRDYRLYLQDILQAIQKINRFVQDIDLDTFRSDAMRLDSTLFNLMTIGEAAKNIPPEIRDLMPEIEWSLIARFRDFVVHHYWDLRLPKVWDIVHSDLPELAGQVEELLKRLDDQKS